MNRNIKLETLQCELGLNFRPILVVVDLNISIFQEANNRTCLNCICKFAKLNNSVKIALNDKDAGRCENSMTLTKRKKKTPHFALS